MAWLIRAEYTLNERAHWNQKISLNKLLKSINPETLQKFNKKLDKNLVYAQMYRNSK